MITSKQRAELRRHANTLETIFQVGKDGIDQNLLQGIDGALAARELIKCRVQDNCPLTAREACDKIAALLGAEPVQTIGSRFVLYRRNKKIDRYGI